MTGLGRLGGWAAGGVLSIAIVVGAVYLGVSTHSKTGKQWLGWVVALSALVLLIIIFSPAVHALKSVSCRGMDDYQACMDADSSDDY